MNKAYCGNRVRMRWTSALVIAVLPATLWAQAAGKGADKGRAAEAKADAGHPGEAGAKDEKQPPHKKHGDPMAQLGLSKDEETRIQKLRSDLDETSRPLFDEQRRLMDEAQKAWQAPQLDKAALKDLQKKLRGVQSKLEDAGFDFQMKLCEVLTPQQRKKMTEGRPPHPGEKGDRPSSVDREKEAPASGKPEDRGPRKGGPGGEEPPPPPMGPGFGMFGMYGMFPPPPPPADQPPAKEQGEQAPPKTDKRITK